MSLCILLTMCELGFVDYSSSEDIEFQIFPSCDSLAYVASLSTHAQETS